MSARRSHLRQKNVRLGLVDPTCALHRKKQQHQASPAKPSSAVTPLQPLRVLLRPICPEHLGHCIFTQHFYKIVSRLDALSTFHLDRRRHGRQGSRQKKDIYKSTFS